MVQNDFSDEEIPADLSHRALIDFDPPEVTFPIQRVRINWDRLTAKRPLLLETLDTMPAYLLKPEVLTLLAAEKNPGYRLILDIMWSTGARVSEALALTPSSFKADRYNFGVILKTLKQGAGRPSKRSLLRSPKRYIPIVDRGLQDRIQSYLYMGKFKRDERIFPFTRQTVNRRIDALAEQCVTRRTFRISSHTLRHSFAIHLLLHGRPLKYVSQLLGHKNVDSTEIYTNVLTFDGVHFLEGVDFH